MGNPGWKYASDHTKKTRRRSRLFFCPLCCNIGGCNRSHYIFYRGLNIHDEYFIINQEPIKAIYKITIKDHYVWNCSLYRSKRSIPGHYEGSEKTRIPGL